jgi:PHP domain-containing protein
LLNTNLKLGFLLFLLFALLCFGCSDDDDDDSGDDDGSDDDDDIDDDDSDDDDNNDDDDDDFNLSDPLGDGEVRAGQISAENELIGGPRARGEVGDYKIYNSHVEFIIRSPEHPGVSWGGYSGNIIDADRARPQAEPGQDNLLGVDNIIGIVRSFWAQEIEVVSDGSDGTAIIRVAGKDGGNQFIDSLVGAGIDLYKQDYAFRIVNEYILEADKDYLTTRTTVFNDKDVLRRVVVADIPVWSWETETFLPRKGFDVGGVDPGALLRWIGAMNTHGKPVSYGIATSHPGHKILIPYVYGTVNPSVEALLKVEPMGQNSYERIFIVGDGDTSIIRATLHDYDEVDDFGTLDGELTLADGGEFNDTSILVFDDRPDGLNYVAILQPDSGGRFDCELSPGQYTLVAQGEGRIASPPEPFEIVKGEATPVDVDLDQPGYLEFDITDDDAQPVPCKIMVYPGHNADLNGSPRYRFYSVTGNEVVKVAPGDYTVAASRGYEYEIDQVNATIIPGSGNTFTFTGEIEHSVKTPGWITTDFHIHTAFSTDSPTMPVKRIKQIAAEGVEMPVITDHDFVSDYDGYLIEAGAGAWVKPVIGIEVSPGLGHFNAWPVNRRPDRPDLYGLPFGLYDDEKEFIRNYEFPELWDFARDDYGAQNIQTNHPSGWWEYVGFDKATGLDGVDPTRWGFGFDSIEAWNGGNRDNWFALLDEGFNVTVHGNSDSHNYSGVIGEPRNLVAMPVGQDEASTADQQTFVDNDLAHRTIVSNGPFIQFAIEGEPIGGFVTGLPKTQIEMDITVHAPTWMGVDYVKVISNHGDVVFEEAISVTGQTLRFDDTVPINAAVDSWYVVETGHTSSKLGPVAPGKRVFAMTNPIWVDIDGNGEFDPPGIPID